MITLPALILFLPLFACILITFVTRRNGRAGALLSNAAIWAGFFLTWVLIGTGGWEPREVVADWLSVGTLQVAFGLRLDQLSLLMTLIVTGVGGLIHTYSYGYMKADPGLARYFAFLSLFTFSMLGIVLANNFLMMFIFWELVGLSSYLLIGFWFQKASAADASKKAFLANRVGDFGFLVGILIVWSVFGSLHFGALENSMSEAPAVWAGVATAAGLLLFCGAVGKSAQFPLHVWLPDAMEGPTPVSALIHAATMVAAGVYMLCRVFFLLTPDALVVISWVGGFTALLAAVIAVQQNDIKRILAYSTLSQLGYMVMAVGLGGPSAAMFHLTTHAFFKALLFLGAGAVIYAVHHEQDIWKMGGLRKRMPITFWTFLLATLALAGVPPLSGFFSKEQILAQAYSVSPILFGLGVLVAGFTAFYMFRLLLVAFVGAPRSSHAEHAHEVPAVMSWPLVVLAVPSVLAGFWGIDHAYEMAMGKEQTEHLGGLNPLAALSHAPAVAFFSLFAVLLGVMAAWGFYGRAKRDPLPGSLGVLARAMRERFYFDEIYEVLIRCTQGALAHLAAAIDRWIIAGFVIRGAHGSTDLAGRALRMVQTGNLQTYAFLFVLGVAVLLYLVLSR